MRAAPSPRRKKPLPSVVAPILAAPEPDRFVLTRDELDGARQEYLDGLPIAAAVVAIDSAGIIEVERANEPFHELTPCGARVTSRSLEQFDCSTGGSVGKMLHQFIDSGEPVCQFESGDSQMVGGRHFTVRLARLSPLA